MEPWQAERGVGPDLARRLIDGQFPELAGSELREVGAGWDNTVYRLGSQLVFRFPRRELAVQLLERETRLLPVLAPLLPVRIPVPSYAGRPTPEFPWPFAGYGWIAGATACSLRLGPEARSALAAPLAEFLSALHGVPVARARELGAVDDELDRLYVPRRTPRARADLAELGGAGLIGGAERRELDAVLEAALELDGSTQAPCLVHGDLYARHLLLDQRAALCGVIDWGDLHVGARAVDLALVYAFLPARARPRFFARYGEIGEATRRLAQFRGVYHALNTLRYAHAIGDRDLLHESQVSLAQLLEH